MSLDSDQIFDSIFGTPETDSASEDSGSHGGEIAGTLSERANMPRTYASDGDM